MATEAVILDLTFEAGEDLSSDQFKFVVLDSSTKKVRRPDAITEMPLGVLQNKPTSGKAASVRVAGVSKVVAAGALSAGAAVVAEYVSAADAGKALSDPGTYTYLAGVVVEPASAEDNLASVLIRVMKY
jgi:hypothetical protein